MDGGSLNILQPKSSDLLFHEVMCEAFVFNVYTSPYLWISSLQYSMRSPPQYPQCGADAGKNSPELRPPHEGVGPGFLATAWLPGGEHISHFTTLRPY